MKRIDLDELRDVVAMSHVLHQMMLALRRSHLNLHTGDIALLLQLHKSELSRMKMVHRRPQYRAYVRPVVLYRVLRHLLQLFPTFIIYRREDGRALVKLYKRHGEHALPPSAVFLKPLPAPFRRDVRPGTTKWFLQQSS